MMPKSYGAARTAAWGGGEGWLGTDKYSIGLCNQLLTLVRDTSGDAKVDIAPAFAFRIATLHFDRAVHRFANVLGVSRIGDLRSIFKKGVIIAHL
jgi:hypothetical protein